MSAGGREHPPGPRPSGGPRLPCSTEKRGCRQELSRLPRGRAASHARPPDGAFLRDLPACGSRAGCSARFTPTSHLKGRVSVTYGSERQRVGGNRPMRWQPGAQVKVTGLSASRDVLVKPGIITHGREEGARQPRSPLRACSCCPPTRRRRHGLARQRQPAVPSAPRPERVLRQKATRASGACGGDS